MVTKIETKQAAPPAWFEAWFDSPHYHKLYGHRDEVEAASLVDELARRLRPQPGSTMLDLGCGAGRHSRQLASKGFDVTGLDLSPQSIDRARAEGGPGLRFSVHDMRRPFGEEAYDYVFNFFTSFGYFGAAEHRVVVRNIASALRPGGRLVLDYLNARLAQTAPPSRETKVIDGVRYHLTRWADPHHLFKRIAVDDGRAGIVEHVERVAKLGLRDFETLFASNGLRIEEVYGDYRFGLFDPDRSPRLLLVARKDSVATRSEVEPLRRAS